MRLKPWLFLLLLAAVLAVFTYGVARLGHRLVRHGTDLVKLLPRRTDAITFYVDVAALRASHLLDLISTDKAQSADYRSFVSATGFNYTRDLDAVAGNISDAESDFLAEGHFDWARLRNYVGGHGGVCNEICSMPASTEGRWASFKSLQNNVLAIAVSTNKSAATHIGTPGQVQLDVPGDPVWVEVPGSLLEKTAGWQLPAKVLASSLHSAEQVTLAAGLHDGGLRLELRARFTDSRRAQAVRNQLDIDTKMLKLELTREHAGPNPADLTGLLTAGTFRADGNEVFGDWPIDRQLLKSLEIE